MAAGTAGAIVVVGQHCVIQHDGASRSVLVHEGALLSPIAGRQVTGQLTVELKESVATGHAAQRRQ